MVESLSPKFSVSLAACSQSSSLKEMRACSHTREEMLLACVCLKAGAQQSWPVASPVMAQHEQWQAFIGQSTATFGIGFFLSCLLQDAFSASRRRPG